MCEVLNRTMKQDYSKYTNYDNREITVKLFSDLEPAVQAFHKLADSQEWKVYNIALKYVKQHKFMEEKVNSDEWPPIKLL